MTGAELQALRRTAGINQTDMGAMIDCTRHSVSYWEGKGQPCRLKSEPGRNRCKFHGGKSTGPRTDEGKARIVAAQRQRWATYRQQQGAADIQTANFPLIKEPEHDQT